MNNEIEVRAHERYDKWWDKLSDKRAKVRIQTRVERIQEDGALGNHKFLRDSVWELIINYGPGYRVYYTKIGGQIVLLLGGGDKSTQENDIERAVSLAKEIKLETEN